MRKGQSKKELNHAIERLWDAVNVLNDLTGYALMDAQNACMSLEKTLEEYREDRKSRFEIDKHLV